MFCSGVDDTTQVPMCPVMKKPILFPAQKCEPNPLRPNTAHCQVLARACSHRMPGTFRLARDVVRSFGDGDCEVLSLQGRSESHGARYGNPLSSVDVPAEPPMLRRAHCDTCGGQVLVPNFDLHIEL